LVREAIFGEGLDGVLGYGWLNLRGGVDVEGKDVEVKDVVSDGCRIEGCRNRRIGGNI
jgi:hypothetical protein